MAVIGGFRSDLSITCKTDGNFGNVSKGVLFSKVPYQRKWWYCVTFVTKFPQVFPTVTAVRTERKSSAIPNTKRPRKIGGGGNILVILPNRVQRTIHGTLRDIQAALSLTLTLSIVLLVNHKDTLIQCHSFINPYNLIHKRVEINKDFSCLILRTTLCKIQICTTLYRLDVQK